MMDLSKGQFIKVSFQDGSKEYYQVKCDCTLQEFLQSIANDTGKVIVGYNV